MHLFFDLFRHDPTIRTFPASSVLGDNKEPGSMMYVLVSGMAELFHAGTLLEILGPGDVYGEYSLATCEPDPYVLITCSECRFALIDSRRFRFLASAAPDFALHIMQILARRLARIAPPKALAAP